MAFRFLSRLSCLILRILLPDQIFRLFLSFPGKPRGAGKNAGWTDIDVQKVDSLVGQHETRGSG